MVGAGPDAPLTPQPGSLHVGERDALLHARIRLPAPPAEPVFAPVPISCVGSAAAPHATVLLFYPASAAAPLRDPMRLQRALADVMQGFPHLVGRLRFPTAAEVAGREAPAYTTRYHRPWLEYGTASDPGFLLTVERWGTRMVDSLPAPLDDGAAGVADAAPANDPTLQPEIAPPMLPAANDRDLPVAGLKVTHFSCGGAAVCVSLSHVLADAGALGVFVQHVAAGVRGTVPQPLPVPPPLDYHVLDAQAAGALDSDAPDPAQLDVEAQLDVFRYDMWAAHPAAPSPRGPPPPLAARDAAEGRPRGTPPPWDLLMPPDTRVLAYVLEFGAADVERIHRVAVADGGGDTAQPAVSHQDAFVGHLWRLVARARRQTGDEVLDCAMACDARGRLAMPLAPDTPGCWNLCLGFQARAEDIVSRGGGAEDALGALGALAAARRVRSAVNTVTPPRAAAWLHKRAHELDPAREAIVFPTARAVCTTNWTRCALYGADADFGGGPPVFAHCPVTGFPGYAVLLRQCGLGADAGGAGRWYEPGIVVALWLEEDAMCRLLADPELRGAPPAA